MANAFRHAPETEDLLKRLAMDPQNGLNRQEVRRRLTQHRPNEPTHETAIFFITLLFNQFRNNLISILIPAVILSALVGEIGDATIIQVIVLFCGILGFFRNTVRNG